MKKVGERGYTAQREEEGTTSVWNGGVIRHFLFTLVIRVFIGVVGGELDLGEK